VVKIAPKYNAREYLFLMANKSSRDPQLGKVGDFIFNINTTDLEEVLSYDFGNKNNIFHALALKADEESIAFFNNLYDAAKSTKLNKDLLYAMQQENSEFQTPNQLSSNEKFSNEFSAKLAKLENNVLDSVHYVGYNAGSDTSSNYSSDSESTTKSVVRTKEANALITSFGKPLQ